MLLNIRKSGERDKERSKEWLVNTDPVLICSANSVPFDFVHDTKVNGINFYWYNSAKK